MRQVDIKGFENYQITDDGRVWSKKNNKWLKPKNSNGYLIVRLYKHNHSKFVLIHRLVAEHFIPNPDNKPCVDHIIPVSEGGTDNVNNLRWCTAKENVNNPISKERRRLSKCKNVCQYTLDDKLIKIWESTKECGRNGFNQGHIAECCRGERQKHKGYKWSYLKIQ